MKRVSRGVSGTVFWSDIGLNKFVGCYRCKNDALSLCVAERERSENNQKLHVERAKKRQKKEGSFARCAHLDAMGVA